jgi:hypothetical protein
LNSFPKIREKRLQIFVVLLPDFREKIQMRVIYYLLKHFFMKTTFEHKITRTPEGTERGKSLPELPETQTEVVQVLELPELKARPRNLDYAEVQTALVEQLREYAERAKITSLVI